MSYTLLLSLLCQSLLPGAAVQAQSAAPPASTPPPIELPNPQPEPAASSVEFPGTVTVAPPPAEALASQSLTPTLSIALELQLDRAVLLVGESLAVTMTVRGLQAPNVTAQLTLALPAGLKTGDGQTGVMQWPLPVLAADQTVVQVASLQVDAAHLPTVQAVFNLVATVQAAGYETVVMREMVGVASSVAESVEATEAVEAAGVQEVQQTSAGIVLQDRRRTVTLLVPPTASGVGVTFRYTPLFQVPPITQTVPLTPETPLPPVALPLALYLPLVQAMSSHLTSAQAEVQSSSPTQINSEAKVGEGVEITTTQEITGLQPNLDYGLPIYQLWELTAVQGSQPITRFVEPLPLLIDVSWLAEAGVDPAGLDLWTRESAAEE